MDTDARQDENSAPVGRFGLLRFDQKRRTSRPAAEVIADPRPRPARGEGDLARRTHHRAPRMIGYLAGFGDVRTKRT